MSGAIPPLPNKP